MELDGFGLKGFLAGNLEVIDRPAGRCLVTLLSIRDGTYRAYGQDLTIERGRVQFSESPVDNPGLDLRAVRKVDDITAGLRVSGSLRKPEMTLFSTPTMAQNAVLSYLLTGQAPSGSGAMGLAASAALSHVSGGGESYRQNCPLGGFGRVTHGNLGQHVRRLHDYRQLAVASVVRSIRQRSHQPGSQATHSLQPDQEAANPGGIRSRPGAGRALYHGALGGAVPNYRPCPGRQMLLT